METELWLPSDGQLEKSRENVKQSYELFQMFRATTRLLVEDKLMDSRSVALRILEIHKLNSLISTACTSCLPSQGNI